MPRAGPALGEPVRLTNPLAKGLSTRPDAPALLALDETWSWSELEDRTGRATAWRR